ncbi:type II toxin-antitoxin system VapC family toxin [Candidatus Woesearchaeota archaeon]|nr:type II toxin-antitoxin system VapC family toxin [Candidatus Woesearchaeota archaeon]
MSILLDTSFILAFDNKKDVNNSKASIIWNKIAKMEYGSYFVSDHIFDEIAGVSLRKMGKEKALALCQKIIQSVPIITTNQHIFQKTWDFFKETKTNLSFTDCTNIILARLIKSKIVSFDREFKKVEDIEVID